MFRILILLMCVTLMSSCEDLFDTDNNGDNNGGNNGGNQNSAIELQCRYDDDIKLTNHNKNGLDYIVDCELKIYGGVLSIEPGTSILFEDGAGLVIGYDGKISALGTGSDPIIMKGSEPSEATWRGIYVNSDKSNKFEYVHIEDAGEGENFGVLHADHGAITVQGKISISNSVIDNSGSNGILSLENLTTADFSKASNLTITGCEKFPIKIRQDLIGSFDFNSCSLVENGINMIGIHQGDSDRLNTETTIKAHELPYHIIEGFQLFAPLIIEAGVELVMGSSAHLSCDWQDDDYLLIQGTQSNHVTIRGKESIAGYWQGILVTTPNVLNVWEYVDISDGGGGQGLGTKDGKANIVLEESARLTINNCTSSRSGSDCDIQVTNFLGTPTLVNNSPQINNICD